MAVEHLSLAFRFFTVCWLGSVLYYSSVHSCQVKCERACPDQGAECARLPHVPRGSRADSFSSEQIVFRGWWVSAVLTWELMSFAFVWKVRSVHIESLASLGVSVYLIFVFVFVALCVCASSGTWVHLWQQVLNLPKLYYLESPKVWAAIGEGKSNTRAGSIEDNLTLTTLAEIDFTSWLKSICSRADTVSSWGRLAHTNILGFCQMVEC